MCEGAECQQHFSDLNKFLSESHLAHSNLGFAGVQFNKCQLRVKRSMEKVEISENVE